MYCWLAARQLGAVLKEMDCLCLSFSNTPALLQGTRLLLWLGTSAIRTVYCRRVPGQLFSPRRNTYAQSTLLSKRHPELELPRILQDRRRVDGRKELPSNQDAGLERFPFFSSSPAWNAASVFALPSGQTCKLHDLFGSNFTSTRAIPCSTKYYVSTSLDASGRPLI